MYPGVENWEWEWNIRIWNMGRTGNENGIFEYGIWGELGMRMEYSNMEYGENWEWEWNIRIWNMG